MNNPVKYADPSGHDPWWNDPLFYLDIYTKGGIYQQNAAVCYNCTGHPRDAVELVFLLGFINDPEYRSIGPAKITDAQMETPYGDDVIDPAGSLRGHGLGLRTPGANLPDQMDINVAESAMGRRVAYQLGICEEVGCNNTDKIIIAALAANEQFDASNFKVAHRQKPYFNPDGTFNWDKYIQKYYSVTNQEYIRTKTIPHFIKKIESDISGVEWDYINGLTK